MQSPAAQPGVSDNTQNGDAHPLDFLRLYLITDRECVTDLITAAEQALKGGVTAIQLREKDLSAKELLPLARSLRALTREHGARLFINDRVDVALMAGADGVHLGEASLAANEVRALAPDLWIGVSTHSLEGALKAQDAGADFITFSPIFETASKKEFGPTQGLERLKEVCEKTRLPVLALGGIKKNRISTVLDQGAFGVALISGIWNSSDITKETFEYMKFFPRR